MIIWADNHLLREVNWSDELKNERFQAHASRECYSFMDCSMFIRVTFGVSYFVTNKKM